MPRVLLVHPNHDDFLSDGLFHGLRTLLGADAVDFPRIDPLYQDFPEEWCARMHGHGFTLYRTLPEVAIDRNRALQRAVDGEFDLVVFADVWRTFGHWVQWMPKLRGRRIAVVDGSDRVEPYPYAGEWWRVRHWWTLPRAHTRAAFFKREIAPLTWWFRSFLLLPPGVARRLGMLRGMRPIGFSIPEEKIVAQPPAKEKLLAAHVVDSEVAARTGATRGYVFDSESAYYDDLRRSRFGVTTKRAGWDALRHYEIAANGAVPCFRDLDRKPPLCAPHGLDDTNCVTYGDHDDLMTKLEAIDDARYAALQRGALEWARANTTRRRAEEFLAAAGVPI